MTASIFADASMVSTVVRVRDVAASVAWYREKLGLEPIHVGADGPAHPHRRLWDRRFGGSLWQLLANRARVLADNDRNSYVVVVMNGELESARRALIDQGVDVGEVRRIENNEFVWFHDLDNIHTEFAGPGHHLGNLTGAARVLTSGVLSVWAAGYRTLGRAPC